MLRKSIETRDCLSAVEPRTVRAAMKRVVEDLAAMDVVIGQLYEEGTRTERTSDSTRRSYSFAIGRQGTAAGPARSTWSITPRYHNVLHSVTVFHACILHFSAKAIHKLSVASQTMH